jgi:hypothetical protein
MITYGWAFEMSWTSRGIHPVFSIHHLWVGFKVLEYETVDCRIAAKA